jgi:hypothetical protein
MKAALNDVCSSCTRITRDDSRTHTHTHTHTHTTTSVVCAIEQARSHRPAAIHSEGKRMLSSRRRWVPAHEDSLVAEPVALRHAWRLADGFRPPVVSAYVTKVCRRCPPAHTQMLMERRGYRTGGRFARCQRVCKSSKRNMKTKCAD